MMEEQCKGMQNFENKKHLRTLFLKTKRTMWTHIKNRRKICTMPGRLLVVKEHLKFP